jgi:hypothetical protein
MQAIEKKFLLILSNLVTTGKIAGMTGIGKREFDEKIDITSLFN